MSVDIIGKLYRLATGDLTYEERRVLSKAMFKIGWRGALAFHVLWACGWLTAIGLVGFAKADVVDAKIQRVTQPIIQEQTAMRGLLESINDQLKMQVSNSLSSDIRMLVAKRCKEIDSGERERINREIDRKQDEYRKVQGYFYGAPGCQEL